MTDIYSMPKMRDRLAGNSYVGRGIVCGLTPDAKSAVCVYFIMGRSANSRNRVFRLDGERLYTEPFDPSRVEDPSLIIYNAVRRLGDALIITNGDQTDTVYDGLCAGKTFSESLESRAFEPDAPNFTPRISAIMHLDPNRPRYSMSILKSIDAEGTDCCRFTFDYPAKPGLGHFIHTYACDGSPLPTFCGEPERAALSGDIDTQTDCIWNSLDAQNRISLYVRYTELATGRTEQRLINRNGEDAR